MIAVLVVFCAASIVATAIIMLRQLVLTILCMVSSPSRHLRALPDPEAAYAPGSEPTVTVIVPAHNEEAVISGCLEAMARIDYPADKLDIAIINDRSTDRTREIIDDFIRRHPGSPIRAIHRPMDATPGKSAAIGELVSNCDADVFVYFDADYLPRPELVRRLVTPFTDPKIAATMGRVVPVNSNANALTRLIDLERRGGYAVDLEMRQRLGLLPQFGGTVGAIRRDSLLAVGGWKTGYLTEDTEITYRFFVNGYDVVYLNDAECYEESPETWRARYKQIKRWAYGHNQVMLEYAGRVLSAPSRSWLQRIDAFIVLVFYLYPALALLSLPSFLALLALDVFPDAYFFFTLLPFFVGLSSLAPLFMIFVACLKDRHPEALQYLPLLFVVSSVAMVASFHGTARLVIDRINGGLLTWEKTQRFRATGAKQSSG